jgi:hypothetical protein
MTIDTTVKYFNSAMAGAPALNASAGAMMAILDACLVTGWGVAAADNITVSQGVATLHVAAGHPFNKVGQVVLISGNGNALDGEQKITAYTTNTLVFPTTLADGTYGAGVAQFKVAPLGWGKTLPEGANIPHYKSNDPMSTGAVLRLDDSAAATCAHATGLDPATAAPFPTVVQSAQGCWWGKDGFNSTTSTNPWAIIGDGRIFYFLFGSSGSYNTVRDIVCFGDFLPTRLSGDPFGAIIVGNNSDNANYGPQGPGCIFYGGTSESAACTMPRSYLGLGTSTYARRIYPQVAGYGDGNYSGGQNYQNLFPNATDGAMFVTPNYVIEQGGTLQRGTMPGQYSVPQAIPAGTFNTGDLLTGIAGLPGKTLLAFASGYGPALGQPGATVFFDFTGPWR